MKINLSPIASDHTTQVSISGLVLTVDGVDYDLSLIPEGGQAEPAEGEPFIGIITRDEVTIEYHYNGNEAVPNQSTDPADYTFDVVSGDVPSPIKWMYAGPRGVVDAF
jgi:hypothetical protein